jgi:hypothetical protein
MQMKTPSYIKSLVKIQPDKPTNRKVWSVDLQTVWIPFFTATNTNGDTAIPADALGHPLRLGYAKDGSVKFSANGKPVIRVAKDLANSVKMVRENFVANLQAFANDVFTSNEDGYKATVKLCIEAGKPIADRDAEMLAEALEALQAEAEANQEANQGTEANREAIRERELIPA